MPRKPFVTLLTGALLMLALSGTARAASPVAVLKFELYDLTMQPNTPAAKAFTAKVAPALRQALARHGVTLVTVPAAAQKKANAGFGYLYQHDDVAAQLGATYGAKYILVGRVHKPTPLFQYLKAHLIDTASDKLVGDYEVELKGQQERLLKSGGQELANQITTTLKTQP